MAGKFCTAFPLTTILAKNSKWLPLQFPAKNILNIISYKNKLSASPGLITKIFGPSFVYFIFLYEVMSRTPVRAFFGHFVRGPNLAENTAFVREYDIEQLLLNFISEISTACELKTTDKRFQWWNQVWTIEPCFQVHRCVASNSFICLYQTRIKIDEKFIENGTWNTTPHFATNSKPSDLTSKIFCQQSQYRLFVLQKIKFYRNNSTSDWTHKSCISCHVGTCSKWQKIITLRQHGMLQIQLKQIKIM